MLFSDGVAIIADDLTGANDTALQFHLKGCNVQVLTNYKNIEKTHDDTQVWAVSTESRNIEPDEARERAKEATTSLLNNLGVEHLYKKIDSTIRGNIAMEIMGVIEASDYDVAIVMPAFPNEGRITVGGYHLLKGVPIERTEFARDPRAPIYESHIPTVLRNGLPANEQDIVALIELNTVKQGAGPILAKLNELILAGKKLIVADALSSVDIEQVMLALKKCNTRILPCGSAGAAQAMCDIVYPETKYEQEPLELPALPKLIVSGSASELAATQIKRLASDEDVDDIYVIDITPEQILGSECDDIIERAVKNLTRTNTVVIHTSELFSNPDQFRQISFQSLLVFLFHPTKQSGINIHKEGDALYHIFRRLCLQLPRAGTQESSLHGYLQFFHYFLILSRKTIYVLLGLNIDTGKPLGNLLSPFFLLLKIGIIGSAFD